MDDQEEERMGRLSDEAVARLRWLSALNVVECERGTVHTGLMHADYSGPRPRPGEVRQALVDLAAALKSAGPEVHVRELLRLQEVEADDLAAQVAALAAENARLVAVAEAAKKAPLERYDTHGWIECVWCHATKGAWVGKQELPDGTLVKNVPIPNPAALQHAEGCVGAELKDSLAALESLDQTAKPDALEGVAGSLDTERAERAAPGAVADAGTTDCVKDYGWWCRTHARDHAVCVAYETCAAICDGLRYKGTVKRPAHDPSVPVTIKAANQALRGAAERIRQRAGAPAEA